MDTLMIRTIMKMDVGEGNVVLDDVLELSKKLRLEASDAGELYGKVALYVALANNQRPIPPSNEGLVSRLSDYFGCTEQDILDQLEVNNVLLDD